MTADILRSDLPLWTQADFDRLDQEAMLKSELVGYDPDLELTDGKTPRDHLEQLFGAEVAERLISV